MKKDYLRDYCTEAFRFYAKTGGRDRYIKYLMLDDIKRPSKGPGVSKPTEAALVNLEKLIETKAAEFYDLDAVAKVLRILETTDRGKDIVKAIEYVYFKDCWRELERGDISDRIHHAEIYIPASQMTIYRWLKKARDLFAQERGLRL